MSNGGCQIVVILKANNRYLASLYYLSSYISPLKLGAPWPSRGPWPVPDLWPALTDICCDVGGDRNCSRLRYITHPRSLFVSLNNRPCRAVVLLSLLSSRRARSFTRTVGRSIVFVSGTVVRCRHRSHYLTACSEVRAVRDVIIPGE